MLNDFMTLLFSSSSHHLTECWPRIVFLLRDRVLDPSHDLDSLHDILYMTLVNIWNMAMEATVEKCTCPPLGTITTKGLEGIQFP